MQNKLILITFISLFLFKYPVSGQKLVNSPYSRFNIGMMEPAGSFRSMAMGGLSTSLRDNSSLYFSNPASYSSIDSISFIFDFGIDYSMNFLSDGVLKYSSDDMNFDHLLMGFPLAHGWGVGIGIVPLSNGYYRMSDRVLESDPEYDPLVGEYAIYHAGDGGFNKFFLGTGININKHLSAGVNMTLLFGQVKRINQVEFFDATDFYNTFHNNNTETLELGGVNFDYGIHYTTVLKNGYFLNAGISLTTGKHYNSKYEDFSFRYTAYSNRDTVDFVSDNTTPAFIPGTLKLGVSIGKNNKFTAGIDFISTRWSASKIPGAVGYTADTRSLLFGAELVPDRFSNYSTLKRVEYRIGCHIGDNYLVINGEQIKEYGASFGLGLPMRRSLSKTNLFFDFTKKYGAPASNIFRENYYTMGISLNLYDSWFRKRKYE